MTTILLHLWIAFSHGGVGVVHNPHFLPHCGPVLRQGFPCVPVPGLK